METSSCFLTALSLCGSVADEAEIYHWNDPQEMQWRRMIKYEGSTKNSLKIKEEQTYLGGL